MIDFKKKQNGKKLKNIMAEAGRYTRITMNMGNTSGSLVGGVPRD